jgi:serine/threonine-protein kinase
VLRRQGALAPQRAMMILRQTADALQAAHDLGIVHRDLKPDTIMLARGRGGADVVKVVDFGIAKAMTGEEGQQVTKTGLVVGTPEYMSPEQISGDVLDGRSDIYSLALVFFRMLTGTLPFQAGTAQEAMIKRLTDDPLPLSDAAPDADFPATLQQVLDRALARMPADRYVSATAFAGDAARAVAALAPTSGATVTEAATELLDTSATTQLPDTRISEASTRGPAATTPQTPLPSASLRPPVRKARWPAVVGAVAVVAIGGGTAYAMLGRGGESRTPGETGTPQDTSGQPSAATPSPELGPVVRDSQASVPSATQQQPLQPPRAGASNQPESGAERVAHPVTVWERLNGMYDSMESGLLTTAVKDSLTTWYADASLPDSTRAKAASLVAFWLSESGENETSILCPWYERAFNLDPARYENLYQAFCR